MKNFYHFSIFNFEVKNEMCKNVLFYFNFKLKIEWHFRSTDWKSFNVVEGSEKKSKTFGKKLDHFSIVNFKMKIENCRQNSISKLKLN